MNHPRHPRAPQQTRLALGNGEQWEQLPRDIRDRCRELIVQLLMDLVRNRAAGGEDER
jgi:hypothetical protein